MLRFCACTIPALVSVAKRASASHPSTPATACVAVRLQSSSAKGGAENKGPKDPSTDEGSREYVEKLVREMNKHPPGYKEKWERDLDEIESYYATTQPGTPVPLRENTFRKGEFGMRRRIHVSRLRKDVRPIDGASLEEAMATHTNSLRD